MNKVKWLLELLFKALGFHNGAQRLLFVFIVLTVIQLPYSIPGMWKTGWAIYFAWKNNLPPSTLASSPTPPPERDLSYHHTRTDNVGTSEDILPRTGPPAPHRATSTGRPR